MGYGNRAVSLLQQYYEGNIPSLKEVGPAQAQLDTVPEDDVNLVEEHLVPRKHLPPLLLKLNERKAEKLDYLGVSYGLTADLLRFWKKAGFSMVYLRQTANDLTGEHSCIMLKVLAEELGGIGERDTTWLPAFRKDFLRRFVSLLSYQFCRFHPSLALNILSEKGAKPEAGRINRAVLDMNLSKYDMRRLELYAQNMVDYHLIMDLVPIIAKLVFLGQVNVHLSAVQSGLLLGLGLQHKSVDDLEKEFELPTSQLLALLNKVIRKVSKFFTEIVEADIESLMAEEKGVQMTAVGQTLEEDLREASDKVKEKHKHEKAILTDHDLTQYAIKGSEEDWKLALNNHTKTGIISVKGKLEQKRKMAVSQTEQETMMKSGKRRKVKQKN